MLVYVAPPRGKRERATCLEWLNHYGHEVVWLDLRRKVKGPLILCGGADIGRDTERDEREFIWIKQALDNGQPIIGLCRGMQILNHYFGGTVEDLPDTIVEEHKAANFAENTDHSGKPSRFHTVESIDGQLIQVNSRHHQHCKEIASNFRVTHRSYPMNSIAEGFEDEINQIWAVQWHPEKMESEDNEYPLNKIRK